jgi:tRNA pseudouridine55 synthase
MPSNWRPINGVLLFDKPLEISSNTAMQKVRRIFRAEKAGHTGTLDPLATGLLPVCFGEATKYSMGLLDSDKTYIADLKLGEVTTTGDAEGEIISRNQVSINESDIRSALDSMKGEIMQTPPMHSALKYKGKPLYEYIRNGETIERQSRKVHIHDIQLIDYSNENIKIQVACSKGTYIRTLAEDIGRILSCGAHLQGLRRIKTGPFDLENACTLNQLEACDESERDALLLPVDSMLLNLQKIDLSHEQVMRLVKGQRLGLEHDFQNGKIRIYSDGMFAGVGVLEGRRFAPERMISSLAILAASKSADN